ncbi:MAG: MarR family transcriptional regulator [Actinomycetota bacterium]|nr:MarR family transcriptional regulator [Actinomycetota bacterium]
MRELLKAEGVYGVYHSLQEAVHEMPGQLDLTEALADAIWQLDPAEGAKSRRALAGRLHCDPSNVTLIVDRLEERGLVESSPDRSDQRVRAIALTPAGIKARNRLVTATASSPTFAPLTHDEKGQLARLLARCARRHPARAS